MKKPMPPCYKCEDRQRIRDIFGGNCHNANCPNGWAEYYAAKKKYQAEKKRGVGAQADISGALDRAKRVRRKTHER